MTYTVFPGGEINAEKYSSSPDDVHRFRINSSDELMAMLLYADAAKNSGTRLRNIEIAYFPYARADRVFTLGGAHGLKVMAELVNSIGVEQVRVTDPHSEAVELLVNNCCVTSQSTIYYNLLRGIFKNDILVHQTWVL